MQMILKINLYESNMINHTFHKVILKNSMDSYGNWIKVREKTDHRGLALIWPQDNEAILDFSQKLYTVCKVSLD